MIVLANITDFQRENAEAMEAEAERKEHQSLELSIEAADLRQRAARLRQAIAYGIFRGASE